MTRRVDHIRMSLENNKSRPMRLAPSKREEGRIKKEGVYMPSAGLQK
jgi:hypothetical protein